MKYKVIDNFLDKEYFDRLVTLFTGEENTGKIANLMQTLPWFFHPTIAYRGSIEGNLFYMTHMFYDGSVPLSRLYDKLIPLLDKLDVRCLIRIKANLYPNTEILHEHPMHIDFSYSHSAAILSLNTCDGYTKLKDGTKIDSIANRILLFDASEEHCSTTTTNVPARININLNYIQEQTL